MDIYKNEPTSEVFGSIGFLSEIKLEKFKNNFRHLLKPKFLMKLSPGSMRKESEGSRLTASNAFNLNRVNNINNYETGISSTLGFDYKVKNNDITKLDFSLAQVINEKENKKMSDIISEIPKTFQTPTMAPFCKDEEKYTVVESLIKKIQILKNKKILIDNQKIKDVLTVNGIRFSLEDGSWGLIRASSNKPSLVIVTESPTSDKRKKRIFEFIDTMLQKTGKVRDYDQKI